MKKILLIEDNLEIRENTAEILELADYEVVTAENGKIGVEKAKAYTPDLIICDIMMPELDGYGVLHILSKLPATSSVPFIFLTAKAEKSDFRKGMTLGADDYITKPFEELDLLNTIERRLEKVAVLQKITHQNMASTTVFSQFYQEAKSLEKLSQLSEDREVFRYNKGHILYLEDHYPRQIFHIEKGKIKTFKTNEDGKELITGIHSVGDFLGYRALIEDQSYTESAIVLEACELSTVSKKDFHHLLFNDRDVASLFIKMLAKNLTEQESRLIQLAYNSVRRRLADTLLMLHQKYEGQPIDLSREDLANLAGTTKESVIRTLSDFKAEGLIQAEQYKLVIQDQAALQNLIG